MNKFQKLITTATIIMHNPLFVFAIASQMLIQFRVAIEFLQFSGLLSAVLMSAALTAAHIIPAYAAYVIGQGRKSKIGFALLSGAIAFVLALTFSYCVLGVLCQPILSLVVDPTIRSVALTGVFSAAYGAFLDVVFVSAFLAQGGLGNE